MICKFCEVEHDWETYDALLSIGIVDVLARSMMKTAELEPPCPLPKWPDDYYCDFYEGQLVKESWIEKNGFVIIDFYTNEYRKKEIAEKYRNRPRGQTISGSKTFKENSIGARLDAIENGIMGHKPRQSKGR